MLTRKPATCIYCRWDDLNIIHNVAIFRSLLVHAYTCTHTHLFLLSLAELIHTSSLLVHSFHCPHNNHFTIVFSDECTISMYGSSRSPR